MLKVALQILSAGAGGDGSSRRSVHRVPHLADEERVHAVPSLPDGGIGSIGEVLRWQTQREDGGMSDGMTTLSRMAMVIGAKRAETVKAWQRAAKLAARIAEAVAKDETIEQVSGMVDEFRIAHLAVHPHTARLLELLTNERKLIDAVIDVALMRLPEEDRGEGEG